MVTSCPCGSDKWNVRAITPKLRKRVCAGCGLLTPLDSQDERALLAWYETEYWQKFCDEQTGTGRDNLYAHILAWLKRESSGRGTVLDVGCGGGAFLALCRSHGWDTVGVEPSLDAVAHARRRGLHIHGQAWPVASIADRSVDAVTFINVLDHLSDPIGALREAARVLKPDGRLYIRVPNAPLHARLKQVLAPLGMDQMAVLHLYGFGRRTFSVLLPKLGFAPVGIRTAPPAQGHAYQKKLVATLVYDTLKSADLMCYRISALAGLDRLGWGASLDVLAGKMPVSGANRGRDLETASKVGAHP